MDTDPVRYVPDLEPGQEVLIKRGPFGGMQRVVTMFHRGGNESEPTTMLRVNVTVHGRLTPVQFTNPTVSDLERSENLPKDPPGN